MESTLAWLDFNAAERERTQRVLAMFEERKTRADRRFVQRQEGKCLIRKLSRT